jgi:hypothetical protein
MNPDCNCAECVRRRAQKKKANKDLNTYIHDIRVRLEEQSRISKLQKEKEKEKDWAIIKDRLKKQEQERRKKEEWNKTQRPLGLFE